MAAEEQEARWPRAALCPTLSTPRACCGRSARSGRRRASATRTWSSTARRSRCRRTSWRRPARTSGERAPPPIASASLPPSGLAARGSRGSAAAPLGGPHGPLPEAPSPPRSPCPGSPGRSAKPQTRCTGRLGTRSREQGGAAPGRAACSPRQAPPGPPSPAEVYLPVTAQWTGPGFAAGVGEAKQTPVVRSRWDPPLPSEPNCQFAIPLLQTG